LGLNHRPLLLSFHRHSGFVPHDGPSPLPRGEGVRLRRFHQPQPDGPSPAEGLPTPRPHNRLRPAGG
jgi:hypothetical protein